MALAVATLLSALAAGLAVVAVTWFADRIGGSAGGLLATAPVTTTAAFLYLTAEQGPDVITSRILLGGASLFFAIAPMPAYFYIQKWLSRPPLVLRIGLGITVYLGLFTAGVLVADAWVPRDLARLWFPATFLLVLLFYQTFMCVPIDPKYLRGKKGPLTWWEGVLRFGAGAAVIFLVDWLGTVNPTLGAAWAVFPGVFVVTLIVLGLGHGAAFSARAAQAASLGGAPLALFLVTYWFLLPVSPAAWWSWAAMAFAWGAYFGALVPLYRMRKASVGY